MMNVYGFCKRRRRLIVAAVGAAALVVLAALLGPYVYIHFIEGPAPAKLELPKSSGTTTSSSSPGAASTTTSLNGSWNVGTGSLAGYRVQEVLIGPERNRCGPYQQDLGRHDHCRLDGDEGDLHRRLGERRERPERAERSVRRIDHGREPFSDRNTHPLRAD